MAQNEMHPALDELLTALDDGTLALPALPDMAAKVLNLIDDPNASADQIIRVISGDPVISAQLVKNANSAAFADKQPVANLSSAVSRLGFRMLRNLVLNISLSQSFRSKNPTINRQLQAALSHSREVAVNSYVLAQQQRHLKPDQAMLAGLMHNIGILPLCLFIEQRHPELPDDAIENLILKTHWRLGSRLLQSWKFPEEFVEAAGCHEDLQRDSGSNLADYTDIVTIANMLKPSLVRVTPWENIVAMRKLNMLPEDCRHFLDRFADKLSSTRSMLGIA